MSYTDCLCIDLRRKVTQLGLMSSMTCTVLKSTLTPPPLEKETDKFTFKLGAVHNHRSTQIYNNYFTSLGIGVFILCELVSIRYV